MKGHAVLIYHPQTHKRIGFIMDLANEAQATYEANDQMKKRLAIAMEVVRLNRRRKHKQPVPVIPYYVVFSPDWRLVHATPNTPSMFEVQA